MTSRKTKSVGVFPAVLLLLVITGIGFLVAEGASSAIVVALTTWAHGPVAERRHTQFDADLGWVNIPDLDIEDMYGPGVALRTNAQGFRNDETFPRAVPAGRVRAICSGDSFTLGYGVGNDETWCSRLATMDPRLETVNLGQGGYGIDQAYLWYMRDGTPLEHDVHLFAFITPDFERMRRNRYHGYGKPVLAVEQGRLVTRNVPVPRRSMLWLKAREMSLNALESTRSVQLVRRLLPRLEPAGFHTGSVADPLRGVVREVFRSLQETNRRRGSELVLVYLPRRDDERSGDSDHWRAYLRELAAAEGWHFVDLVARFRTLSRGDVPWMFMRPEDVRFRGRPGHYTVAGNDYVARALLEALRAIPAVSEKLVRVGATPEGQPSPRRP